MSKEVLISKNKSPRIDCVFYEVDCGQVRIVPVNNSNADAEFEFFVSNEDMGKEDVEKSANAKFVGLAKSAVLANTNGSRSSFCFVREVNELGRGDFVKIGPLPSEKPVPTASSEFRSDTKTHEQAKAIMEAKKAEICGNASPLVGGACGGASAYISAYERPAIVIIERIGQSECTMEFATAADYKAWKELE